MTHVVVGTLLGVVTILAPAVAALMIMIKRRARAEQFLRESEDRYRRMADRAPVMMWTCRPDATLTT